MNECVSQYNVQYVKYNSEKLCANKGQKCEDSRLETLIIRNETSFDKGIVYTPHSWKI